MASAKNKIEGAFETVCAAIYDAPLADLRLSVTRDEVIWADVRAADGTFILTVNEDVPEKLEKAWNAIWNSEALRDENGRHIATSAASMAALSLRWMLLHELMHVSLGHFVFANQLSLIGRAESAIPQQRSDHSTFDGIADPQLVRHCFELQCDSDASHNLLAECDLADLPTVRLRIAAIVAVLASIEVECVQNDVDLMEHPSTALRFQCVLGIALQAWSYELTDLQISDADVRLVRRDTLPDDRLQRYQAELAVPAIHDAIEICDVLGADRFFALLGDEGAFLQDLHTAQYTEAISPEAFQTEPGREWANLRPINVALLMLMTA